MQSDKVAINKKPKDQNIIQTTTCNFKPLGKSMQTQGGNDPMLIISDVLSEALRAFRDPLLQPVAWLPYIPPICNNVVNSKIDLAKSLDGSYISHALKRMDLERVSTPGDGHCLLHAVGRSWKEQIGGSECPNYNLLKHCLLSQEEEHPDYYLDFVKKHPDRRAKFHHDVTNYVHNKIFDNSTGDFIPLMITNALKINIIIINENEDSEVLILPFLPSYHCQIDKSVIIHRKNDHFSALRPMYTRNVNHSSNT